MILASIHRHKLPYILVAVVLLGALFATTPMGAAVAVTLFESLAAAKDLELRIGRTRGRLLGTVRLEEVYAATADGRFTFAAEKVGLSLIEYSLELVKPDLEIRRSHGKREPSGDPSGFSVARFPARALGGRLRWQLGNEHTFVADSVNLAFVPTSDSTGTLSTQADSWFLLHRGHEVEPTDTTGRGRLGVDLLLAPQRITVAAMNATCEADSFLLEGHGKGQMRFAPGMPASADVVFTWTSADSARADLTATLRGGLDPLDLELAAEGELSSLVMGHSKLGAEAEWRSSLVELRHLSLQTLGGRIDGNGTYGTDSDSLALALEVDEVALLGGSMSGHAVVKGRVP